jgi:glutaredoxin-like protein NrdH
MIMIEWNHVDGIKDGRVKLFALSTCVWCKKTKRLLDELGIGYDYVFVDLLDGDKNVEVKEEVRRWNPNCSFPTIVVNDSHCIVGFDEAGIRKLAEE